MTPHEFYIYRCHHHMAQADMAKQLGVSRATINRWERGLRPLPDDILARLANREVGTLKHRTAAQEKEHRERVELEISTYRQNRSVVGHEQARALGQPWQPETLATLASDPRYANDFKLDETFNLKGD